MDGIVREYARDPKSVTRNNRGSAGELAIVIRCSSAFASLLAVACSSTMPAGLPNGVTDAAGGQAPADGPGAFSADFATSAGFFTQMKGRRKGLPSSPHNLVQIWYSLNMKPLVTTSHFTAPKGSVAIKVQDRSGGGVPENIMVMIKQAAGFEPTNGDWSYEQRAADGTLQDAGKIAFCIGCHTGFPATDDLPGVVLRDP
jgi:hypothetical protein